MTAKRGTALFLLFRRGLEFEKDGEESQWH